MRKQTEEARLAATRELAAQYQEAIKTITHDAAFAMIWLKGVRDYDALPTVDRMRLAMYFQHISRIMEQQYLHTRHGHVDPAFFESIDLAYGEFLTFPGAQRWWELSKDHFCADFRARVDAMLSAAKQRGYRSSFKERNATDSDASAVAPG